MDLVLHSVLGEEQVVAVPLVLEVVEELGEHQVLQEGLVVEQEEQEGLQELVGQVEVLVAVEQAENTGIL